MNIFEICFLHIGSYGSRDQIDPLEKRLSPWLSPFECAWAKFLNQLCAVSPLLFITWYSSHRPFANIFFSIDPALLLLKVYIRRATPLRFYLKKAYLGRGHRQAPDASVRFAWPPFRPPYRRARILESKSDHPSDHTSDHPSDRPSDHPSELRMRKAR